MKYNIKEFKKINVQLVSDSPYLPENQMKTTMEMTYNSASLNQSNSKIRSRQPQLKPRLFSVMRLALKRKRKRQEEGRKLKQPRKELKWLQMKKRRRMQTKKSRWLKERRSTRTNMLSIGRTGLKAILY